MATVFVKSYFPRLIIPHTQTRSSCRAIYASPGLSQRRRLCPCQAVREGGDKEVSDPQGDLENMMEEDMKRWEARRKQADLPVGPSSQADETSSGGSLKEQLDKVLIANFFFICIALAWLAGGIAEKATLGSTNLIDSWYPLWPLIFQPAIGVLMLGALVSGAAGWLQNRKA